MEPFDCELIRAGWPAQPVNTLSSAAFVAAGFWLWRRGERAAALVFFGVGIGSVLFHGSPGRVASAVHTGFIVAVVVLTAIRSAKHVAAGRMPWRWVAVLIGAVVLWSTSRTGGPLCAPSSLLQGHSAWHVLSAAALAAVVRGHPARH